MRYREQVEIEFEVSREPLGWMHDTLDMPRCLAGWLEANGFHGVVTVTVDALIWGVRGGPHGWDDSEDFRVEGMRVGVTPVPRTVSHCALAGEWAQELDFRVRERADSACLLFT